MSSPKPGLASLTTVAHLPKDYFLENLVVRRDGSILVTAVHQRQLWYIPRPNQDGPVEPSLVHTFEHLMTGIAEAEPDVFYVNTSDLYTTHESDLQRVDLRDWETGASVTPETVIEFDDRVRGLNGNCLIAPGVLLVADCFAGLIWRVDLPVRNRVATATVWLEHDTMRHDPDSTLPWPPQPGVNGIRYAGHAKFLYYTNTAQQLFMRVAVHPGTYEPLADPEHVTDISMADDFCIDELSGVAYITRHRENTLDRVSLQPGKAGQVKRVAGESYNPVLTGPSSAVWGRDPGDYGRVAYITTDGGTTAPPPQGAGPAAVVRAEFATSTNA